MTDINELSAGIARNLATIGGIRTYAEIPDNPNLPAAVVNLSSIDYDQAYAGGLTNYFYTVIIVVGRVTERRAQQQLNVLAGSGSGGVKAAIQSDRTLDGAAFDCVVTGLENITSISIGDVTYLTAEFAVTVRAE